MKEFGSTTIPGPVRHRPYLSDVGFRRRERAVAGVCSAAFLVVTVLVHYRILAAFDRAVAAAAHSLDSALLYSLGAALNILFSAELSVACALLLSVFLWRRGFGLWSLSPFAFVMLVVLEIAMKATIHQPLVPPEFHRESYYPLASVHMEGSFPSGHAIRGAFLSVFPATLLSVRGRAMGQAVGFAAAIVIVLLAFTRLYLGHHWLSDVVAGTILGGAAAWIIAAPVARRLAK